MRIGLVQLNPVWENIPATKERIAFLLEQWMVGSQKPEWLIFPEMTLSGFTMSRERAQLIDSDLDFFRSLAIHYQLAVTFGGAIDGYNKSVTIDRAGQMISSYAKVHLFSHVQEEQFYRSGDASHQFALETVRITPAVCYDLRFSYLFWNAATMTDVFVIIANWPARRITQWEVLLRARAIENQCFAVGVNRTGDDPTATYDGRSMIVDPFGNLVLSCDEHEGIFIATIALEKIIAARSQYHFLQDRIGSF
jgi:predicted amidohydrolase